MSTSPTNSPITAHDTIEAWLSHPAGGPVLRAFLESAGSDADALKPAYNLPLATLVELSGGKMTRDAIDGLVAEANGGHLPPTIEAETTRPPAGKRFADKTVIVTGAANGIGRATTLQLLGEGARVVAVDVSAQRLTELVDVAGTSPEQLVTVTADLAAAGAAEEILAAAGDRIDGLANIAGIMDDFSALHEVTDEMWSRVFAVNVDGLVRPSRAVTGHMLANGGGSIVNVASEAGLRGSCAGVAYTASKHAVVGITKSMAVMYANAGIRTNAVAPGAVMTGIPIPEKVGEFGHERLAGYRGNVPSMSTAEQQAAAIVWLLSDDAASVNGAILPNDGGWSAI
ncbi:Levodione reductase [Corynebacterium atrinae]|uniref:SDR family NAD(P)-dependent oxidoreductase n=1 Tax=Corynebacterium atrinae TaxID=1336740 RepID=UPI0025B39F82|nr:SDR family NAD(P)-dependent oxidoreductase [Corynebacterium atrinae]WJY64345.1 Levodione reductase [Corynebacterium atrinae]